MKTVRAWLGFWFAGLVSLQAQVTVEVSFDQQQFLPGETLNAEVRIENFSGQTLHLGEDEGWLKFAIESQEHSVVTKTGDAPVREKIDLDSSKAAIKVVNLAPYFNLKSAGQYSVSASVWIKDWNKVVISGPASFEIIKAKPMWTKEFGVPNADTNSSSPPEVRKFALLQANYLQKLTLYLQVTDAAGKILKVRPLGRMLNIVPDAQIDRLSNLHVLYQTGAHWCSYLVFNTDGELTTRQTYSFTALPHLRFDAEGKVFVLGGLRQPMPDDVPAGKAAPAESRPLDEK